MPEQMVGKNERHHRLSDRNRTNADTWIVPPSRDDLGLVPGSVDGTAWRQYRGRRLDGKPADDGLAGGNSPQNTACMI